MTGMTRRRIMALDFALDTLDRAEGLLHRAGRIARADPAAAFELAHRASLRGAGVVIERENRTRARRLPLNAWRALSRCGAENRQWAEQMGPLVLERDRLSRQDRSVPDPALLSQHLELTASHLAAIRHDLLAAELSEAAPLAG